MPKYVLHYFNARGRAEVIRTILAVGDVQYTDHRINFPEWPELKPSAPLLQLPYLEIDDVVLPQAMSIVRYLARELNLYGQNGFEQSRVDAYLDTLQDSKNVYVQHVLLVKDPEEQKQAFVKFLSEELPKHLRNIEKLISLYGKNGHAVGNSLTVADLAVFDFVTFHDAIRSAAQAFPLANQLANNVAEHPKVAAYVKSRPNSAW